MEKNRAKVYIDGANMLYSQKKMGWNIDWVKAKEFLMNRWDVLEIRYYTGIKENDEKMKGFIKYLQHIGITTITKTLKVIKIGPDHPLYQMHHYREMYKSNFDVEMTTDIMAELLYGVDNYDKIKEVVFWTGDSDFKYLMNELRKLNIGTTVFASKLTLAWELKFAASHIIKLEEIRNDIERKV